MSPSLARRRLARANAKAMAAAWLPALSEHGFTSWQAAGSSSRALVSPESRPNGRPIPAVPSVQRAADDAACRLPPWIAVARRGRSMASRRSRNPFMSVVRAWPSRDMAKGTARDEPSGAARGDLTAPARGEPAGTDAWTSCARQAPGRSEPSKPAVGRWEIGGRTVMERFADLVGGSRDNTHATTRQEHLRVHDLFLAYRAPCVNKNENKKRIWKSRKTAPPRPRERAVATARQLSEEARSRWLIPAPPATMTKIASQCPTLGQDGENSH